MFKWAVIGTGNIANTVCGEIVKSNRHKIVAVFSRTQEKAMKFANKFNAKSFNNLEEFFQYDFDGVYIATPHSVHYKYLIDCIMHNKPVISEKSFTVNKEQAKAVFDLASKKRVFVAEAMWTRFNPAVLQAKKWVEEGLIGEIREFKANFCVPLVLSKPFMSDRVYKPEYAGGALLDLGVYPISYAHNLFGYPKTIETNMVVKQGVDFDERITLKYDNNIVCNLWSSFNAMNYYGEIVGTKGKIKLPMFFRPNKVVLKTAEKSEVFKCKMGYIYEFDAFAKDIKEGKTENSMISHKDTIDVMTILDECRKLGGLVYPETIEKL